ncbi:NfeD family protein [Candidatus Sumerlaeota bacterium]|nr:NfeD family protein [Candidatus Sumerlaeales bacterium]NLD62081.1 NfeD family protein [Candidatus Sumerlaeota bacterium]
MFPLELTPITIAVIWMCTALILLIIEIFTPGFVIACFSVGCLFAAATQLFSASTTIQVLAFSVGTILALFLLRPILLKRVQSKKQIHFTNISALAGKIGVVTQTFDDRLFEGRVRVGGDDWKARSTDKQTLAEGTTVRVISVNGVTLSVVAEDK